MARDPSTSPGTATPAPRPPSFRTTLVRVLVVQAVALADHADDGPREFDLANAEAAVEEPPVNGAVWVEPVDGACPVSHPVKGNAGSGIYHVPGGASYDRTVPERCYVSPEAAEADGFRRAKR